MKDLRCFVGLHSFSPKQYPAGDRFVDDVTGLKLDCTRCQKSKVIRVGSQATHPGQGMHTADKVLPDFFGGPP